MAEITLGGPIGSGKTHEGVDTPKAPEKPAALPATLVSSPATTTTVTTKTDASAEETTPSQTKLSENQAPRPVRKTKKVLAVFSVTVQCRHKQCEFLSKFPFVAGVYVFVEGDRGEDVGRVIACEKVDVTSTSSKTSGNVLRAAKTSELDSFHSLSQKECACVKTCQRMVETLGLPLIVVLVIWGNRKCFDRYPVQRRAQCEWLFEEFRE